MKGAELSVVEYILCGLVSLPISIALSAGVLVLLGWV